MILVECNQGTIEWAEARAGVITASNYEDAVTYTAKGLPTAKMRKLAATIAMERIYGKPLGDGYEVYNTWQMQRGSVLEDIARDKYERRTGNVVLERGVILTDDRRFGYSTDGLVRKDGGIEIKALLDAEKIVKIFEDGNTEDFDHQMQGGLWLTGRKWIDFILYCPQLEAVGADLYIKRIERDEAFIADMEIKLVKFAAMVDAAVEAFKRYGKTFANVGRAA